jgi:hypothetical protein
MESEVIPQTRDAQCIRYLLFCYVGIPTSHITSWEVLNSKWSIRQNNCIDHDERLSMQFTWLASIHPRIKKSPFSCSIIENVIWIEPLLWSRDNHTRIRLPPVHGDVYSIQHYVINVCQWLTIGQRFSPGTPVSFTNKTDRYDIVEILLNGTLNTIHLNQTYSLDNDTLVLINNIT